MKRVAVLASGRGSNLGALIEAERRDALAGRIVLTVSERASAAALERSSEAGIPTAVLRVRDFANRQTWDAALCRLLAESAVDIVVCAGFNRVIGPAVLGAYPYRIINVHPALLPSFAGGLHAVRDALAYGAKVTGCTVHFVTDEVDAGPIILQRCVSVHEDDDEESLLARVQAEEHRALPEALRLLAEGRLRVDGRLVHVVGGGETL